ncbi:glycerol-3-phosphate acyltransferase [Paenisporosarcina macmurdoensis]|uniref:Glycerol-3-phosphate acyltransferase n=1 Tax=Paenisporosarcina macmurdoensis TaxID=212659 RepID=A0ABW1LCT6_9BACL
MNLALLALLIILAGYFIGSLHGSYIAQWVSGVKVKEQGVKNSGASNATIVLGLKFGALVALLDIGKGLIAVLFLARILHKHSLFTDDTPTLLLLMGAAVIIGHNFPLWMNFDGGKGTASLIGIMFAVDWRMGCVGLALLILLSLLTDYLPLGVLFLYLTFLVYVFWFTEGLWPAIISLTLFTLAIWKHRENILRIRIGTEPKVSTVLKKKKAMSS